MSDEERRLLERALATGTTADPATLLRLERRLASGDASAALLLRQVLEGLLARQGPETLRDITPRSAPALLWLSLHGDDRIAKRAQFALWDLTLSLRSDPDEAVRSLAVHGVGALGAGGRRRLVSLLEGRAEESCRAWREVLFQESIW